MYVHTEPLSIVVLKTPLSRGLAKPLGALQSPLSEGARKASRP